MKKSQLKELIKKAHMKEGATPPQLNKNNLKSEFESKLKSHDWYHMMSDDNAAHIKGSAEESELKKIAKELVDSGHGDTAADMYNRYNKFKGITFDQYIAPTQPFISRFKRKQMGLGETEFSKQFDNDPALKGGQKNLPDALQKSIVKKAKTNESLDEFKPFSVVEKGGSIGRGRSNYLPQFNGEIIKTFNTAEEAKQYASERRKRLTPGEKSYYGMTYIVVKTPKAKTNESYGSSNDFGGPGLIVVGNSKKDLTDSLWFKVGLLYANGEMDSLIKKQSVNNKLNFSEISRELGNESYRPYISESYNDSAKTDKNIFSIKSKVSFIEHYCKNKNIPIVESFKNRQKGKKRYEK